MSPQETQLLIAALAMGALPLLVYWLLTIAGVLAAARGQLSAEYSRTKTGAPPPNWLGNIGRNLVNLFEFPVLLYALVALQLATGRGVDELQVILAWAFVASRYLHTLIHCTINQMGLRFLAHRAGLIILTVMWIRVALDLL